MDFEFLDLPRVFLLKYSYIFFNIIFLLRPYDVAYWCHAFFQRGAIYQEKSHKNKNRLWTG